MASDELKRCGILKERNVTYSNSSKPLPMYSCQGKGGEYIKLGYAKPAGAIKTIQGDSGLIVYQDVNDGQLYFRDPRDFQQRMSPLSKLEPCSLGGDVIREQVWPNDALDAMRQRAEKAEREAALNLAEGLRALLPDLDDALEDLELHGCHDQQGYRKLKDWFRKVEIHTRVIDAALAKQAKD